MNNELRHANNYKYIKREWKNGKWQYTYETTTGKKGTSNTRPAGSKSNKLSGGEKMDRQLSLVKAVESQFGTSLIYPGRNYNNASPKFTFKDQKNTKIPKSNRDDQYSKEAIANKAKADARKAESNAKKAAQDKAKAEREAQRNSKSAIQRSKTDLSKVRPENQKPAQPVKNEKSLVDAAKQKVADIKAAAKKTVANGTDWIKDKLGYDEKERYEQKTKEQKALEEIRKTTKQESS